VSEFQYILDRHKLRLVEVLRQSDGGLARSDILLCIDKHGKNLILKIFNSEDQYARKRFIDEIKNLTLVRNAVSTNDRKLFPKLRYKRIRETELYYIYDYFKGKPLGNFEQDFGIALGKFKQENFPRFLQKLFVIASFDEDRMGTVGRGYTFNRVRKELEKYEPVYADYTADNRDVREITSFLYSNSKIVFSDTNMTVCQTDLYPANLFVNHSGGKIFKFLDWEYLSRAPIGFLPAFMFLMFWKEEFWSAKIYAGFYNYYVYERGFSEDIFNMSFRFFIVLLGLRFWYQSHSTSANGEQESLKQSAMTTFSYFIGTAISGDIVKPTNVKFYIDKWDVQKIADKYRLGKVIKNKVFYSGKGNTVVKVETEDLNKYIFRFYYKNRTLSMIRNELSIYDKLSSNGICSYKVFKSPKDELFITTKIYGRQRRVAVLSFLEGSRITKRWDSEKSTKRLGRVLYSIHTLGIVHNDFSKENVLFTKGKITGLIDFEWGIFTDNHSMYRKDLAKAIALWLTDVRGKSLKGDKFIYYFLLGYYNGKLPEKNVLKRIIDKVEYNIEKEQQVYVDIFYKHLRVDHKNKALTRFVHAKSNVDLFRKVYID